MPLACFKWVELVEDLRVKSKVEQSCWVQGWGVEVCKGAFTSTASKWDMAIVGASSSAYLRTKSLLVLVPLRPLCSSGGFSFVAAAAAPFIKHVRRG